MSTEISAKNKKKKTPFCLEMGSYPSGNIKNTYRTVTYDLFLFPSDDRLYAAQAQKSSIFGKFKCKKIQKPD